MVRDDAALDVCVERAAVAADTAAAAPRGNDEPKTPTMSIAAPSPMTRRAHDPETTARVFIASPLSTLPSRPEISHGS